MLFDIYVPRVDGCVGSSMVRNSCYDSRIQHDFNVGFSMMSDDEVVISEESLIVLDILLNGRNYYAI